MTILVTGGGGFLGAWVVRRLHEQGEAVRVFDRSDDRRLVELLGVAGGATEWVAGDIADTASVRSAASGTTRIVHLAGLLTPACSADPIRGAQVNLIGTLNVFEAARANGHDAVVYASTAGVFGPTDTVHPEPHTHYGAFKLACEGSARAYHRDHGIASVGLRPYVVYGPGREGGASAGPTLACRAAAWGRGYVIPYGGRAGLVFAGDVASAFAAAASRGLSGAHVATMAGTLASNEEVIALIRAVVPGAALGVAGPPMPIAADLASGRLDHILPGLPVTPLADGLRQTIEFYRRHGP